MWASQEDVFLSIVLSKATLEETKYIKILMRSMLWQKASLIKQGWATLETYYKIQEENFGAQRQVP